MAKRYFRLIFVMGIILAIFLSIILYNELPFLAGKKIMLATTPIDPFDPFRGQYMTINYEISSIDNVSGFLEGDAIYVTLVKDGSGVMRYVGASRERPVTGTYIRGMVNRVDGSSVRVEYGLEQFFYERDAEIPTTNITVEAILTGSGRAKISQLYHNGKPVEIRYENFSFRS